MRDGPPGAAIAGNWDGLHPGLILKDVTVVLRAGRVVLRLARIDQTLSWLSVMALEPRFSSIELHQPALRVSRDKRGIVSIAGVELTDLEGSTGFGDWLLRQKEIVVRDALVTWHDELRGAPPLALEKVTLGFEHAPPVRANGMGRFNYIRNSVKIVIDAYNGTMNYYLSDPADPIIKTYASIFPGPR